jgi:hypothetical protein
MIGGVAKSEMKMIMPNAVWQRGQIPFRAARSIAADALASIGYGEMNDSMLSL